MSHPHPLREAMFHPHRLGKAHRQGRLRRTRPGGAGTRPVGETTGANEEFGQVADQSPLGPPPKEPTCQLSHDRLASNDPRISLRRQPRECGHPLGAE
jgi:hypothetical protein